MIILSILSLNIIWILSYYLRTNFTQVKNSLTKKDLVEELKSGIYTHNNQFVVQWVTILTLLVGVMVPTHHTTTPYFLVTTYTIYSALAVLILGLLSVGLNNNNLTPHLSLNSFLLVCLGAILPLLNNIILIYLFFEIIVYLVLYLVLVQTQVVNENQSVVKSTIWLFIINFVSSITLFYGIYSYICSGHYQTTVSFLNQAGTPIWVQFVLYVGCVIKFASGPWLFYNTKVYENINFNTLLLYTILFCFSIKLVLLSWLNYFITTQIIVLCSVMVYIYTLYTNVSLIKSAKQLFAFSTSIISIYVWLVLLFI